MNTFRTFLTSLFLIAFLSAGALVSSTTPAHAVRVSLKRIVFDSSKRSEILTIINNTSESQTYRLGWRKYRMDEGKTIRALGKDEVANDILWADEMIRFAPRRITVPAGASQQIRLLLRRPKDLQQAEYRAHLWIVSEVKPDAFTADESQKKQSIRLAVQPSISLPIFVRNGDLNVEASITDAKIARNDKGLNVSFKLNRSGDRSIYGDFDFVCTDGGQENVIQQIRGIAVYREVTHRNLSFNLAKTLSGQPVTCSNLNIVYRADPNDPDFRGKLLAQSAAAL